MAAITYGQIVLFNFPQTDLTRGKLRPALVINKLPGKYDDWLLCMISSSEISYSEGFDEKLSEVDKDYINSGLKSESIIRISRLAVVDSKILLGKLGEISNERLERIRQKLSDWILGKDINI